MSKVPNIPIYCCRMRSVKLKEMIHRLGSVSDRELQEGNPGQQQEPSRHARETRPDQITESSKDRYEGRTSKVVRDRVGEWAEQSPRETHTRVAELENKCDHE